MTTDRDDLEPVAPEQGQRLFLDHRATNCSKLPRPTRSLGAWGPRSLLEGGAFPKRHCAPRPHAWTRPGFLFPFHGGGGGSEQCCDPRFPDLCRGLSRRFNSRCSRALSPTGERESNPFAVVVPECGARRPRRRATGASLLVTPTDPDLCEDGSIKDMGRRGPKSWGFAVVRDALPPRPTRSLRSLLEAGGSALPLAEPVRIRDVSKRL